MEATAVLLLLQLQNDQRVQIPKCAPLETLERALMECCNERRARWMMRKDGGAFVLFSAPDGSTWTLVLAAPGGMGCIVEDGPAHGPIDPCA